MLWLFLPDPDHLRIAPRWRALTLGHPAERRLQEPHRVGADRLADGEEFEDIDATFAALVLGDEGLVFAEPFGELLLGETGAVTRPNQQLAKSGLPWRMYGFSDAARAMSHRRSRLIRTSDYPKTGY